MIMMRLVYFVIVMDVSASVDCGAVVDTTCTCTAVIVVTYAAEPKELVPNSLC